MGIFTSPDELESKKDSVSTWAALTARENQMLITKAPTNYFEKMARWTDQGKVWKFPIDNEQGKTQMLANVIAFIYSFSHSAQVWTRRHASHSQSTSSLRSTSRPGVQRPGRFAFSWSSSVSASRRTRGWRWSRRLTTSNGIETTSTRSRTFCSAWLPQPIAPHRQQ